MWIGLLGCGTGSIVAGADNCPTREELCAARDKNCGTVSDECEGTIECGSCPSEQTCGGGGVANECGSGSGCTPTTCLAQGKNCGSISDGCAAALNCGSCSGSDTCGGGGVPNVCGQASTGGMPAGWLYTSGSKIYVSNGAGGGTPWMGRGVNVDDVFLCGGNSNLSMSGVEQTLTTMFSGLMSDWKPNFLRLNLSMHSGYVDVDWLTDAGRYTTPTTNAINFLGTHANTYVLVTLRSHASMVETNSGNEATFLPTNATDAMYVALVNTFANSKFVMFGLCNEPGTISPSSLVPVMSHAVGVIRAEEDRLGVPHHIVSVQGKDWTSDISFYATSPLPYDNVVYEVHGYEPPAGSYTYSNIPVILGEYGPSGFSSNGTVSSAFHADIEAKQIPNLAWNFEPYSDCTPSLVAANDSATNLVTTPWGSQVKSYLLSHAP
jgi:hypothetical protein